MKYLHYRYRYPNFYFWRTKDQQEVDWVEEENMAIDAYEFKSNETAKLKFPKKFVEHYQPNTKLIHTGNFSEFILD